MISSLFISSLTFWPDFLSELSSTLETAESALYVLLSISSENCIASSDTLEASFLISCNSWICVASLLASETSDWACGPEATCFWTSIIFSASSENFDFDVSSVNTSSSTKVSTISVETSGDSLVVVGSAACLKSSTLLVSLGISTISVETSVNSLVVVDSAVCWKSSTLLVWLGISTISVETSGISLVVVYSASDWSSSKIRASGTSLLFLNFKPVFKGSSNSSSWVSIRTCATSSEIDGLEVNLSWSVAATRVASSDTTAKIGLCVCEWSVNSETSSISYSGTSVIITLSSMEAMSCFSSILALLWICSSEMHVTSVTSWDTIKSLCIASWSSEISSITTGFCSSPDTVLLLSKPSSSEWEGITFISATLLSVKVTSSSTNVSTISGVTSIKSCVDCVKIFSFELDFSKAIFSW